MSVNDTESQPNTSHIESLSKITEGPKKYFFNFVNVLFECFAHQSDLQLSCWYLAQGLHLISVLWLVDLHEL